MDEENLNRRLSLVRRDSQIPSSLIDSFGAWVRAAPDEELFRVDVLRWAEHHGSTDDQALDLFLHAAAAGVFSLTWGVICPMCGMMIQTPGGLRAVGANTRCNLCRVSFPASADDELEVTFSLEPGIRKLRFYEPDGVDPLRDGFKLFFGATREPIDGGKSGAVIRAAGTITPGSAIDLKVTLDPGTGALIVPELHAVAFIHVEPGHPSVASLEVHDGAILPADVHLGPGALRLHLTNRTHHQATTLAAQLPSGNDGQPTFQVRRFLTGKRVLTSQAFRELFRTETIGDGGLSIKSLAMLFTDLQASTALYERVGDLRALELVRAHFDKLMDVVREHRGAIVKTIGDAVMAAFAEPEQAVAAAAEMNHAMQTIATSGDRLVIKVGVHAGSCIAIHSNNQIDYFGSAVNTAARVQGVARGGEIVVTESIWNAPGVRAQAAGHGLRMTADTVSLRGIAEPVAIFRLQ